MKPSHTAVRVVFGSVSAPAWILAALLSGGLLGASARAAEPVGFNHDIRPILSDACFHCHGPDPGTRKAGLRLDTREGFFAATAKRGPAVVAGDLGKSPLWQRLVSTDIDEVMPPPEAHKDLTATQKEVVKRWKDHILDPTRCNVLYDLPLDGWAFDVSATTKFILSLKFSEAMASHRAGAASGRRATAPRVEPEDTVGSGRLALPVGHSARVRHPEASA
jgi:hypothetical protein